MKSFYRIVAAGLALVAVAACDSRRLTSNSSGDTQPPIIDVAIPGDPNRTVDVGDPLLINVTAADNLSLLRVEVTVIANNTQIAIDTVQFSTQTPTYQKQISVTLNGVSAGTRVAVYGVALDGAGNTARDSAFINVSDDTPPDVVFTVPLPTASATFKTGNLIRFGVRASDEAGVNNLGYEFVRFRTDSVPFVRDSATFPTVTTKDTIFSFTVPANMPPGEYGLRAFATDASGNRGESEFLPIAVRDTVKPTIEWIVPAVDQKFGLQDSVLVTVRIRDAVGLQRLTLVGIATRGDTAFGIVDTIVRFDSTFAPINVAGEARSFPEGTTDVTISRWLKPTNPSDTITEPVLIVARVTDISNNVTQDTRRIQLVSGPRITIVRPGIGSVTSAGKIVIVEMHVTDRDGIIQVGYNVPELGAAGTRTKTVPGNPVDTIIVDTLFVPASTPAGTKLTITPFGFDRFGQPGSGSPVIVTVQATIADTNGPRVYQDFGAGFETDDTVRVRAIDPDGIASVGYQLKDSVGVTRDSGFRTLSGSSSDETVLFQMNVPVELQGGRVRLISFARDTRGNLGYSLPAGDTVQRNTAAAAAIDTIDVVFGRTFSLPNGGLGADIAVDTIRKNTFISNLTFDRLEVFENATQRFSPRKVAVGADPWGMFVDGDTLLVANSAGTNISRVVISGGAATAAEVLSRRIKTPLSIVFDITTNITQSGERTFAIVDFQFSDRPQYIGQMRRRAEVAPFGAGTSGDIFYSTRPTLTAPAGTIRRYDVYANEAQQVWQYGKKFTQAKGSVAVFNADSAFILTSTDATQPDRIVICDHPYGVQNSTTCIAGTNVLSVIYGDPANPLTPYLRQTGSDVVGISEFDVLSLSLTDTTFVAVGGDRRWVAFGEGNSGERAGRVMMAKDTLVADLISGSFVNFFSPSTYVTDLTNNASDRIFGLALNKVSDNVAIHGVESFFADVPNPYLLRLQGKVNTFQEGTGIAFHPDNGDVTADGDPRNVAFVASQNGRIEIVDTYHYTNRGSLPVSANLYGPIRAVRSYATDNPAGMLSTDPNFVVVKLYGLTVEGLIVIDVRNRDIRPLQ